MLSRQLKLRILIIILVENVPALLKLELQYVGKYRTVLDILQYEFGEQYKIDSMVVDSADYGVPQTRLRAIIKMNRKGKRWSWPLKKDKITVRDAIGQLNNECKISARNKFYFKLHKCLSLIFASKENIYRAYPFCQKHNYPIVLCWLHRGFCVLFSKRKRTTAFKLIRRILKTKIHKL